MKVPVVLYTRQYCKMFCWYGVSRQNVSEEDAMIDQFFHGASR